MVSLDCRARDRVPVMSVLRSIESKLEALFEGVFGRAFRSNVQPVELARKLVKEMDDHRSVSVSRVYVPNEYSVYLAPSDRAQFADYEPQLCEELQDYLAEHARRERYVLLTSAEGQARDRRGARGRGVRDRDPPRARAARHRPRAPPEPAGATTIYRPEPRPSRRRSRTRAPRSPSAELAVLTIAGQRHELGSQPRSSSAARRTAEIRISDPNVSRRHAEVRPSAARLHGRRSRLDQRDRGRRQAA